MMMMMMMMMMTMITSPLIKNKVVRWACVIFEVVRVISKFMTFGIRRRVFWFICPKMQGVLCQETGLYISVTSHKMVVSCVASAQNQCIPADFMLSVHGAYLHLATQPRFVQAKQTQPQRFSINHSYRNAGFSYEDTLLFQFQFISYTARAN